MGYELAEMLTLKSASNFQSFLGKSKILKRAPGKWQPPQFSNLNSGFYKQVESHVCLSVKSTKRTRSIGIDEIPDRARNISDIFINPFSILIVHHNQVLIFPTLAFFFTIFKWLNK